LYVLMIRTYNL